MNVSLTPKLKRFVQSRVKSGEYSTSSEVVREALRLLQERQESIDFLRRAVREGLDDVEHGRVRPLDLERIRAEGRRRLAARAKKVG